MRVYYQNQDLKIFKKINQNNYQPEDWLLYKIQKQNGAIQASKQEKKAGKAQKADQMGAFLDSSEDLRQNEKSSSGQAHKAEKALEKKQEQGVKMIKINEITSTSGSLAGLIVEDEDNRRYIGFHSFRPGDSALVTVANQISSEEHSLLKGQFHSYIAILPSHKLFLIGLRIYFLQLTGIWAYQAL